MTSTGACGVDGRKRCRPRTVVCFLASAVLLALTAPGAPRHVLAGSGATKEAREFDARLEVVHDLVQAGRTSVAEAAARELLAAVPPREDLLAARALDALVTALVRRGKGGSPEALEWAQRAVAIKEALPGCDALELGISLENLSSVLYWRSHMRDASHHYRDLLERRARTMGADSTDLLGLLNGLGSSDAILGDEQGAESALQSALAIAGNGSGFEHPLAARASSGLAVLHALDDRFDTAREFAERAAALWERQLAGEPIRLALVLDRLAQRLETAGDESDARWLSERAVAIWDGSLAPEHAFRSEAARRLARLRTAAGERSTAGAHAGARAERADLEERSRRRREQDLEAPSLALVRAEMLRAEGALRAGDRAAAAQAALEAHAMARESLQWSWRALTERHALQLESVERSIGDLLLGLAAGGIDSSLATQVFAALVGSRATVLDEMATRRHAITEAWSREVPRLQERYAAATVDYANALVKATGTAGTAAKGTGPASDEVRRTARAREDAEAALAAKSAVFRRRKGRVDLPAMLAALPEDGALVAYAQYHELAGPAAYLAFALRHGRSAPSVIPLGPASEIDRLVERWRVEVGVRPTAADGGAESRYHLAAEGLRRRVWDPLPADVRSAERVFVVPDAALHELSFGSLPATSSSYLLEVGPVLHYLSAERDLLDTRFGAPTGEGLLALGEPAFDAEPEEARAPGSASGAKRPAWDGGSVFRGAAPACEEFRSVRFEPLPASRREVEAVARLWGRRRHPSDPAVTLTGAEATEAAFKHLARGKRVLHLATHGFFLPGSCAVGEPGARGIGRVTVGRDPDSPHEGFGSLLLAGLALAGANRRTIAAGEDGILTAEEVAALDLSGVQWVVLSACDTGRGIARAGEGIFGLRRAFEVAGVRTLILSLWSADDRAAQRWMERLYAARFGAGLDTAAAVQQASLEELRGRRARGESTHPFYWAGFVAAGDWR